MPKIFISYRREDSKHAVGRLHAALKRHVRDPKRDIFMDIDNIPRGVDFVDHLDGQVAQCDVMLAIIGPGWLAARDAKTGKRRLDDPADFVRIEVASALKRGIPVVPVMLDDTPIPAGADLPDDLKALARRNGERLEHESFDADVTRLIRNLPTSQPKAAAKPAPARATPSRPAPSRRGGAAWVGPVVALGLLALGGVAWAVMTNMGASPPSPQAGEIAAKPAEGVVPAEIAPSGPALRADPPPPASPVEDRSASPPPPQAGEVAAKPTEGAAATAAEAAAWRVAKDADTRAPLDAYLRDFSNGPNAGAARSRIAALTRPVAPAATAVVSAPSVSSRSAGETFRDCSDCPQMVVIPAGSFMMGSPAGETGRSDDEGPQRRVTIPAFAAGKFEVTWTEYSACVSAGACAAASDDGFGKRSRPVTNVSWDEAVAYAKWLSGKTGKTYRLLSESEWEYAARAGSSGRWTFGDSESQLSSYAWYISNSVSATHAVGGKTASAFGLHDMHGNVWEWVQDCFADNYSAGQPSNGGGYTAGSCSDRVYRGGSWLDYPQVLRSADRGGIGPAYRSGILGFRVARTL